jgi:hypothetical protein
MSCCFYVLPTRLKRRCARLDKLEPRSTSMDISTNSIDDYHSATTMSKSFVPSRGLLSTFSRSLSYENPLLFSSQCRQLSGLTTGLKQSALPRRTPQSCLRPAPKVGARPFSTSTPWKYKTVQEQRSRYRSGVCYLPARQSMFRPETNTTGV